VRGRGGDIEYERGESGVFGVTTTPFVDAIFHITTWDTASGELTVSEDNFAFCVLYALALPNIRFAYCAFANKMTGESAKYTNKMIEGL